MKFRIYEEAGKFGIEIMKFGSWIKTTVAGFGAVFDTEAQARSVILDNVKSAEEVE